MEKTIKKLFKKARTGSKEYFQGFTDTMKVMLKRENDLITRLEKIIKKVKNKPKQ